MTSGESGKPLPPEAGSKLTESPIARDHTELFHYTGIAGLEGIVRTQTLWATHAAFLNDALEIRAFAARLPSLLRASVEGGMSALIREHPSNQSIVDEAGGLTKAAELAATAVTDGMYRALLGAPDTPPFAEPYVTSFCTASSELVARHGLLSQWRGYGREGGYALVFDTARLDLLLKVEAERWRHALFGGDVIYSSASDEEMRKELVPASMKLRPASTNGSSVLARTTPSSRCMTIWSCVPADTSTGASTRKKRSG